MNKAAGSCVLDASALLAYLQKEAGHEKIAHRLDSGVLSKDLAYGAAWLRPQTKLPGLSLADRMCLATAQNLGLPLITVDKVWTRLKVGIPIELAR